jgi:hypothetical protein
MSTMISFRDDAHAPLLCLPDSSQVRRWRAKTQLDYFAEYSKYGKSSALQQPWVGGSSWLRSLAKKLRATGWVDAHDAPRGMLIALDLYVSTRPQPIRLRIPRRPDALTEDMYADIWRSVFESEDLRAARAKLPLLRDVLHVLQCLFPGIFLLEHVRTDGGRLLTATPPADWMKQNEYRIKQTWGIPGYDRLKNAAPFPSWAA